MHYGICNGTIDATGFSSQVERDIREGGLKPRDTLVMSDTKIHTRGENTVLEVHFSNDTVSPSSVNEITSKYLVRYETSGL